MKRGLSVLFVALGLTLAAAASACARETVLFVGNSFTYGALSPAQTYRPASVHDLNGEGIGGVPALFKRFSEEAGLDYDVSLETHPGIGLDWHLANALAKIDRAWDHVVLQSLSTLDMAHPGDRTVLARDVGRLNQILHARNARVDILLDATWSRPDLVFEKPSPWHGKPIQWMADDLSAACRYTVGVTPGVRGLIDTGEAFNRAIDAGLATPNPYEPIKPGQIDLWAVDHYHASTYGYYLEALMVFGKLTGRDPRTLGRNEQAAADLGVSPNLAQALERVAWEQLTKGKVDRPVVEGRPPSKSAFPFL